MVALIGLEIPQILSVKRLDRRDSVLSRLCKRAIYCFIVKISIHNIKHDGKMQK